MNEVTILQIVILFLLVLGLPLVRGANSKKNMMRHGYLVALAVVLHTVLIFLVMIPTFSAGFDGIGGLPVLNLVNVWFHAILGTIAEVLGILMVASWLRKGPTKMGCVRWKKWMTPTFIIWTVSIVNGALIHILGML